MKRKHFTEFSPKRLGLSLGGALLGIPVLIYGARLVIESLLSVTYQIHPEIVVPVIVAFVFYFNALLNERADKNKVQ